MISVLAIERGMMVVNCFAQLEVLSLPWFTRKHFAAVESIARSHLSSVGCEL